MNNTKNNCPMYFSRRDNKLADNMNNISKISYKTSFQITILKQNLNLKLSIPNYKSFFLFRSIFDRRHSQQPNPWPSVEDFLLILDIKNLKDPDKFFMAHEPLQRREIQAGIVPSESNQDSTKPRECQPGLPGFIPRPVQYRRLFSKETLDNNDNDLSSQKAFEFDSIDRVRDNSDKGETSLASLYNEKTAIEEKIDGILKGLLTWGSVELEGVGAMNLLQKRLHIKPINNLLKEEIDIKTPPRWNVGYAEKQLTSPTPPKSPFALFSTLQKYISRSKPSVDPFSFSARESDHVSTKKYSPTHMINQGVNIVGSSEPSDELGAPLIENEVAVCETCSIDDPIRNCTCTPQKSMMDNSMEPELNANVDSNEPSVDMDLDIGGSGMGKRVMDDAAGRQNVEPNEPNQFEDKMLAENMQEITTSIPTNDSNFNLVIPLVRRSSRFKTRPLKYWKGERMVYGRVHESLSTVIGVKRLVPGSDGKQTMEVKSFVSDKYKKLFEAASRY
ncbi:uncharacterized protein LOC131659920 [Vicia villosa]|uniref:uncharacterized protein LOC131659920 n=1 Tax=Vicia villosa TaxID=3911 RepID=UPI00273AA559|nr:uncharacterized protein LOC131659920 [Vicia villosa]